MHDRPVFATQRFDFDVGHLIKSPCKDCRDRLRFPACAGDCNLLDRVQRQLAQSISTTRSHSPLEPFAAYLESSHQE